MNVGRLFDQCDNTPEPFGTIIFGVLSFVMIVIFDYDGRLP